MQQETFNIEALPVKIDYMGETVRDNNWQCDQWRITISNKLGHWTTEYFTGIGLRTKPRQKWAKPSPKKPTVADVLYSLFIDAEAADYNFSDWCDMYGYSNDSITALNVYRQCLDTATNLRKYFTPEQREAIKIIIQDM